MEPSSEFYRLLVQFEGLKLKAYLDSVARPTIGIGTIKYPSGKAVKMGATCTKEQAYEWATHEAKIKARTLSGLLINTSVTQVQFDALLLLVYNIGAGAFAASTLLKRIKSKASIEDIREAWMRWVKGRINGELETIPGLVNRRSKEVELYFT